MADDGWEPVNDPAEIRKVLGPKAGNLTISEGTAGVGPRESVTREAQFNAATTGRGLLRDLARAQYLNQNIPTGRFEARKFLVKQEMPKGWTGDDVARYQELDGLQMALAKPVIQLSAPPGSVLSSQEVNTPKELENALKYIPGPRFEREANNQFIDRAGRIGLDKIAFNAFTSRWRANHGGSVYNKSKNGQTAEQAWADYQRTPAYKATVMTPYTKLLKNGGRAPVAKPQTKAVATIKSDDDYDRLPSGAHFVGPDGKQRVKP